MVSGSGEGGPKRIVVALGGNTLLGEHGPWTFAEQQTAIEETAAQVATLVDSGYEVVLTHGNGPQVGTLLVQQEQAPEMPQLPLDALVAETQAQIGYLLQQALDNELAGANDYVTIVTQVLVDPDDPAFEAPTKPVGPYYTEAEAAERSVPTRKVTDGEAPYRRVVPSPDPVELVEGDEIAHLVDSDTLVICAGGGGIPVVRNEGLRGVEAVVDKDRTARLLAADLGAETLVVLTDVEHAFVNYGRSDQRPLGRVTPDELRDHLEGGQFPEGSMGPKVEACLGFVEDTGGRAVITAPDSLEAALAGETGTQVVDRNPSSPAEL